MGAALDAVVENPVGHLLVLLIMIIGLIALAKAGAAYLPSSGPAGVVKAVVLSV